MSFNQFLLTTLFGMFLGAAVAGSASWWMWPFAIGYGVLAWLWPAIERDAERRGSKCGKQFAEWMRRRRDNG